MVRKSTRILVAALLRVLPTRSWVTVYGWPDSEENSLRIADAVARRVGQRSRVFVLCDETAEARRAFDAVTTFSPLHSTRIGFVARDSLRGFAAFALSRVVFTTHGVYGDPRSGRRRLHVLLGHGYGPKAPAARGQRRAVRADLAVTNTTTWGASALRRSGMTRPNSVIAVGLPREDAFTEPIPRSALSALGLSPYRRLVVWMPTYRDATIPSGHTLSVGRPLWETPGFDDVVQHTRRRCADLGLTLAVKTHPLEDPAAFHAWGVPVITSGTLTAAGLSLYQFLSLSDGLITDYSSVWVDYLASGKPIGLLFRDEESFAATRGFGEPSLAEAAPELFLPTDRSINVFLEGVASGAAWGTTARARIAARIGYAGSGNRTDAVLDAVATFAAIDQLRLPFTTIRG